ncbi:MULTISPECIES: division plane positioning ATPase MipZ [Magnetospirillum]|uniref:ATPase n=1 Tax=Magnetospirillum moscoviense TaxID=1437059 RepID=A0A178MQ87_9PROT|nr:MULTISPECIES: division plane positioning ATPase MipZ [Magnetospirillum]MBF0324000.1 P-loop NTPase [Alphaproteobacteria bacterium]OAN50781.1 ATPase [Magnetospirillum moscoviense]CAA7620759.1 putative ATPase MipZ [Magnetospirillum sp. LM-5]
MSRKAHVVVVGNEKGGTGKSTVSMHLIVGLLGQGLSVGSIDIDARQATLSRYIQNRKGRKDAATLGLRVPDHVSLPPTADREADEKRLTEAVRLLGAVHDVVVIDTPGSDHYLSRLGHSFADTLITPLNDSLIDLDVLARVDPETMRILRPSHYSEMVWETKKTRAVRGEKAVVDWIVLRNRLAHLDARNKQAMEKLLGDLSKRIGFRVAPGLGERVIYRSLFLEGLTLLDLREGIPGFELSMSNIAARQELRNLMEATGLAKLAKAD